MSDHPQTVPFEDFMRLAYIFNEIVLGADDVSEGYDLLAKYNLTDLDSGEWIYDDE